MQTHNIVPGTPEWHAHRATHDNASDAPAMLGCSPYKTRSQYLHERHTGLVPEVDAATQRRFDDGHRFEALARPIGEEIIGDDLAPVVGSEGTKSASFDGLTLMGTDPWEHKSPNDEIRTALPHQGRDSHLHNDGSKLGKVYRVQMEQQLLLCGSERNLFSATRWEGDKLLEERHAWYHTDPALRAEIIAGWNQFHADLAEYVPTEIKEKPKAEAIASLPSLFIHAKGEITTNNMPEYGAALAAHLKSARAIVLITDQDFSNAKEQAKVFREQREKLQAVKESMLSQTTTIGEAARMIDDWSEDLRLTALKIEKDVEKEDIAKKLAMVNAAKVKYADHVAALEAEIAPARLVVVAPDFAAAIKGKRNYSSMQDAIDVALANGKIAADASGKAIRANLAHYKVAAAEYEFLFADIAQLAHKAADDFSLAVTARIDAHKAKVAAKAEQDKRDAEAKALADAAAQNARDEAAQAAKPLDTVVVNGMTVEREIYEATPFYKQHVAPKVVPLQARPATPATPPTLALGEISSRLGFNVTSAFLATLGFEATTVRAAKLYHDHDFGLICAALIDHINTVQAAQAA